MHGGVVSHNRLSCRNSRHHDPEVAMANEPPIGPPVVRGVLLVDYYEQPTGHQFDSSSLPGHLIQLMHTGVSARAVGGRQYIFSPGDLIWYHQDERDTGEVLE